MDYFVKTTTEARFPRDGKQDGHNVKHSYFPAFNRRDAEHIASALQHTAKQNHRDGMVVFHRTFEVVGCVNTGNGNVYLSVDTLEYIASEYTAPQQELAAE